MTLLALVAIVAAGFWAAGAVDVAATPVEPASEMVAANVMRLAAGEIGAGLIRLFVARAAPSTLDATVFAGARVYRALGQDVPALQRFGA